MSPGGKVKDLGGSCCKSRGGGGAPKRAPAPPATGATPGDQFPRTSPRGLHDIQEEEEDESLQGNGVGSGASSGVDSTDRRRKKMQAEQGCIGELHKYHSRYLKSRRHTLANVRTVTTVMTGEAPVIVIFTMTVTTRAVITVTTEAPVTVIFTMTVTSKTVITVMTEAPVIVIFIMKVTTRAVITCQDRSSVIEAPVIDIFIMSVMSKTVITVIQKLLLLPSLPRQ
ncbi:hypothetical protein GE061_008120 [Apolygus lucorum]|uniref:Uncharacterized protein n=1 Tax=Apolygus lucorum TaxID=248454 RepID=A0A8S9WNK6_APOLU|nr:hypothetical protein GE061_008120 [Apolygus lucorum]